VINVPYRRDEARAAAAEIEPAGTLVAGDNVRNQ
jgi:hypothetical protein